MNIDELIEELKSQEDEKLLEIATKMEEFVDLYRNDKISDEDFASKLNMLANLVEIRELRNGVKGRVRIQMIEDFLSYAAKKGISYIM